MQKDVIVTKARDAVIRAATTFRKDQFDAYQAAIANEKDPKVRWILENFVENAIVAERNRSPLCDDTGIPHILLEVGKSKVVDGELLESIREGIADGLRKLPGRPMAINGYDMQRLDQSGGLNDDPGGLVPAPIVIKPVNEDVLRLHVLLQGGGPEIRGKTYRVFHQHNVSIVIDEIVRWGVEGVAQLGCTPCVPAIGIGRSHYEASALMLEAMAYGDLGVQNDMECEITERVNASNVGPLGVGGNTTALGSFVKVGPQRASGVRIVCLRLCCCVEPRVSHVLL